VLLLLLLCMSCCRHLDLQSGSWGQLSGVQTISQESLQHLGQLTGLTHLSIQRLDVVEASVPQVVALLQQLQQLQELKLWAIGAPGLGGLSVCHRACGECVCMSVCLSKNV
jgi:hypothetical protein